MSAAGSSRPRLIGACLAIVLAIVASPVLRSFAGSLAAITPTGSSPGLSVQITGIGFDPAAANNEVSFQPAVGAPVVSVPTAIAVVDAAKNARRLTVRVPAGLPPGPAAVVVLNKSTQEAIGGLTLAVVALSLPETAAGQRGATNLRVRILGSPNSRFGTGSRANFGTGITVVSTTIESATSAVATINITAAAVLGARAVSMISTTQTATQDGLFTVSLDPPPPPTNLAPTVSAGSNQTTTMPAGATLSGTVGDDGVPGGTPTVLWTRQSGPGTVTFANPQSAATSATFSEPGAYVLRLTANDGEKSSFAEVAVGVSPPTNSAPTVHAGNDRAVTLPATLSLTGTADDDGLPAGGALAFTWTKTGGPGTVTFAPANALSTTVSFSQSGTYELRLTAADGDKSSFDELSVVVNPPTNVAPLVNAGMDQTITYPAPAAVAASATDDGLPAGSSLAYTWSQIDGSGTATFATPLTASTGVTFSGAGTYTLRVTVTDGDKSAFDELSVVVNPPTNVAPLVNAGTDQTITYPAPAAVAASATDDGLPAGSSLAYAWSQVDGPGTATFATPLTASTGVTFNGTGTYTLRVTVTDGDKSAFDELSVVVNPPTNAAPAVDAGTDQTVTLPGVATLTGIVSDDGLPTPGSLTHVWSKFSGPGVVTFGSPSSALTTATFSTEGSYVLRLTARDSEHTVFDDVTIAVNPPTVVNEAPIADAGPDRSVTLPAAAILAGVVNDDGKPSSAVTISWRKVEGPGDVTFTPAGVATTSATFTLPGTYTLELRGDDGALSGVDTVTVSVAAPTAINTAPSVEAGVDQQVERTAGATLAGTVGDDGKPATPLQLLWKKVSGPGEVSFTAASSASTAASFTQAGVYVLSLTASDGELATTDDLAVTVAETTSDADRAPPVIELTAPKEALPGAVVELRAQASDDVGVASVRFEVGGAPPEEKKTQPFTRQFNVPELADPGSVIEVRATAFDAAGNSGHAAASVRISVVPDTESPTVRLLGPTGAAAGGSIVLIAEASDNVGIAGVTFVVDGQEVGSDADAPYETGYLVPADRDTSTPLLAVATARDFAGNTVESPRSIIVFASTNADTTPPQIDLTTPAQAAPGSTIALSAAATDANGIAKVTFRSGNVNIGVAVEAPYEAEYVVPLSATNASSIEITAEATDFAGLKATATRSVLVVATDTQAEAAVTGEVYDDTTSLPIAGASVALIGTDNLGSPYTAAATTDARGRYLLRGPAGQVTVMIQRDGWTRVDRSVTLSSGQAIEVLDARLTPFRSAAQIVPSTLGTTVGQGDARLLMPAGGLAQPTPLRITKVGQQGSQGVIPRGWSPVGGADIAPHATTFAAGATLRVNNVFGIATGTSLVAARWDEAASTWRAIGPVTIGSDVLEAMVDRAGHFVFLVPDTQPLAPALPNEGDALQGVAAADLPLALSTTIDPQPRILFYRPGAFSEVRGQTTASTPVSSGARLSARLSESYAFYSGSVARPASFVEDLIVFQIGAAASSLAASFVVTPSLEFEPIALERGVIAVELFAQTGAAVSVPLVGSGGGTIDGPAGTSLRIPVGAVTSSAPIALSSLESTDFGAMPLGLSFIQGVQVTLADALARGASLSVPRPDGVTSANGLLLVRLESIAGSTRLVLAGVVRIEGDQLVSDTIVAGQQTALLGVRDAGRYAFVRSDAPLGFAGGLVKGVDAAPFAGALVTSGGFGVVSLSNPAGAYLAAAPAGAASLIATDLIKSDLGTASTFLTAAALLPVTLQLAVQPPRVTALSPVDGTKNVPLASPITVTFSEAIDPLSVAGANLANVLLAGVGGARLEGAASLSHGNTVLTFRPADALQPNAAYTLTLGVGIKDVSGYGLTAPVVAHFDSLDTAPPPPVPAGALAATIPNAQGLTTVSGTQGSAAPTDRIFVDNLTKQTVAVALVQPNGSFSTSLLAGITDKLRVRIVDAAGNETIAELGVFKQTNLDGSMSQAVSSEGGVVQGPNGVQATIKPGTFPSGAVVTLKDMAVSEFPVQFTPTQAQTFTVNGGLSIDFGGEQPQLYVDVSLPPVGGETATDQWVVARLAMLNDIQVFDVVDTGKFRNGRITTASPPCPGVTAAGAYGFIKSRQQIGVNYAQAMPNGGEFAAKMFSQIGLFFAQQAMFGTIEELLTATGGVGQIVSDALLPEVDLPLVNILTDLQQAERQKPCFPVLTGDVTVSPNTARVRVDGDQLRPADRQIIVTNSTSGEERQFPHDIPELRFLVPGSPSDDFKVTLRGFGAIVGGGEPPKKVLRAFDAVAVDPATVAIRINPDEVDIATETVEVLNLKKEKLTTFPIEQTAFEGGVPGSVNDTFFVTVVDAKGVRRGAPSVIVPPPYGPGNLLARARPGTIDPTREEMNALNLQGPARTKVHIVNDKGLTLEIPPDSILQGGFAHAFDGDGEAKYSIVVFYDTRPPYSIGIPNFRVEVTNTRTGKVLKTLKSQAPPRDEPLQLPPIENDETVPIITAGPVQTNSFDPSGLLQFTFSEAMDPASVKQNFTVLDKDGGLVEGEVRISGGNRVATFVPRFALHAGETYTVLLTGGESEDGQPPQGGMQDRGGNSIATLRLQIKTFAPTVVGRYASAAPLKDVALRRQKVEPVDGPPFTQTTLFVTAGGDGQNLVVLDATDVRQPQVVSYGSAQASRQKISLLPEVSYLGRTGTPFIGDLAVVTRFNVNSSSIDFVDVTARGITKNIGGKVLTINPDLALQGYERNSTMFATGFAKGVAALPVSGGAVAYAAVERVGIMATDVADNTPSRPQGQRVLEGVFACDAMDVAAWSGTVAGLCRDGNRLLTFEPGLGVLGQVTLPYTPRKLRIVENLPTDVNGDGVITASEVFDLAIVGGDNGISVVDVRNPSAPVLVNAFGFSGVIRDLDVDHERRRIFAGADLVDGGPSLIMLDLSDPIGGALGATQSFEQRLLWKKPYPAGFNGLRLDSARGVAYVASPSGLDIYAMYDTCCDLRVEMTAAAEIENDNGERDNLLRAEQVALQRGIAAGLKKAQAVCGLNPDWIRIFESGSSACIWDKDPAKTCTKNYQPGVSDHDLSAFFSNEAYASKLTRPDEFIPDDPPVTNTDGLSQACTPTLSFAINEWSMAVCTIQMLDDQFTDKDKRPIKFDVDGIEVKFDDISFIPNSLPKNVDAKYDLCPTDPNIPGDNVNDMALGRQLLVLKHVTEARWIDVPGWTGKTQDSQGRTQQLAGQDIELTFTKLRANGVPLAEGFEWANLMEWNFVKSASLIRIPGAADETSIFHHDFIKQLHTGGKAGIRAAAARMVADPNANARFMALTRNTLTSGDPYSISMEGNACLFAMPDVDSQYWPNKPCDSLEEYIASAAARTRRPWKDQPPLALFSEADVNMIHRFYRVKSDQEIITDDFAASQFAATVIRFVMRVQQETKPAYDAYMNGPLITDDERTQRVYNMNLKARELEVVFKKPELHVVPRVANTAFTDANGVLVKMYANGAPATYKNKKGVEKTLEMRVDLSGGDRLHLEFERDANGFETRDGKGKRTKFFMLPVDQSKNIRVPQTVSFTLDLPDRRVSEADRLDNVGGFFYWIMDKDNPDPTPPPMDDGRLIPAAVAAFLDGDASCTAQPALSITQSMTVDEKTFEGPPAVLGIGQPATLHITVTNQGVDAAEEARACSSATNACYPLGSLAPGAVKTISLPFVSREQVIIDAVPTAYAVNRGIATGEQFRIVVACEPYAIVPFSPDPNPTADKSTIMAGGTALRHFMVIDRSTGDPFVNATVRALIRYGNGQTITRTFTTDEEGAIGTTDGDTFIAGVAVPSGTFAGQIEVEIQAVNDLPIACNAAPKRFTVDVKPLTFTEAVKGGAAISGEFSLLGGTAKLGTGAGLSLSLSGERQPDLATSYSKLTLGRSANVSGKISAKKDLFDVGLRAGATFQLKLPSAEAGVEVSLTAGEKYTVASATVEGDQRKGLGGLIIGGLLEDNAYVDNKFYRDAMQRLNQFGGIDVPSIEILKVSESAGVAIVASANLNGLRASGGLGDGESDYVGEAVLAFDAGLSGKAGISFNLEKLLKDQKLKADMGLNGEFNVSAGFNAGFITQASKIDSEESSSYVRKVKKDTLRKEEDRLKIGGDIAGGIKFSATLDPLRNYQADRLDITFTGKKNFGLKVNYAENPKDFINLQQGGQYSVTYSTTVEELITKGLRNLPSLNLLMPPDQKEGALPDGGVVLSAALNANGPTSVWEDLMEFLTDVMSQGTFTRNDDRGVSVPLSFGFKAKVLGTGVDFESKFTFDQSVSWLGQRGMLLGGRSFTLEDYSDVSLPFRGPADLIGSVTGIVTGTADVLAPFYKTTTQKTPAAGNKAAMVNENAALYLDQADAEPVAGIISYTSMPLAGPVAPEPYDPASSLIRPDRPHYGVGGFHSMEPSGLTLNAPAEIRLAYTAADIQGIDASTLQIYRWSDERADWDPIGGTLDSTNRVVTASITKLGTFTLGPRMPAGRISWTVTGVSTAGNNTRVRLRSAPIVNNDGTPIEAGSLVHVSVTPPGSPVPLGSVLTADADAGLEGNQVAVGADGTVEVDVEVFGPPGIVTLLAFTDIGTAVSTDAIQVPQQ